MVKTSDKKWPTGEGNGKPIQHSSPEDPWQYEKAKRYDTER